MLLVACEWRSEYGYAVILHVEDDAIVAIPAYLRIPFGSYTSM